MTYGYKKLLSEKNFLKVAQRARALRSSGSELMAIYYKEKQLIFKTRSATEKNIYWTQKVEITDLTLDNVFNKKKFRDIDDLVLNSGLKLWCSCPAWLYWGYKYMAWKRGYGIEKEIRRPRVRNPHQKGFVCFVGGTRVLTEDGYKPIEEVKPGDYVFTHKGRLKKVLATSSHFADRVLRLTYGNTNILCTPNHKFLASKNKYKISSTRKFDYNNCTWIKAEDLVKGDMLVAPRLILNHTVEVSDRVAFFTGLYVGDGTLSCRIMNGGAPSAHNGKYYVHGCNIALDKEYREQYESIFDSYNIPSKYTEQKSVLGSTGSLCVYDKDLWRACLIYGNFTSENWGEKKKADILNWTESAQKQFVKGFFLADGTIVNGGGKRGDNTAYITLFNTNQRVMNSLLIVLKQWYDVKLCWYDRAPFEEYGHIVFPKRMYYIRFTGKQCKDLITDILGEEVVKCKSFGSKNLRYTDYKLSEYVVDDTVITPKIIKEIGESDSQLVYNIEVEEDNSYIVEDVAVHNCKHLYFILQLYPFWSKYISSKFLKYYTGENEKVVDAKLRVSSKNINRIR